mgnify:FL=1
MKQMERNEFGQVWFDKFLEDINKDGVSPDSLNPAIARMVQALNQGQNLEEARLLELVRSADFLLRVQRVLADKPDRIVGHRDLDKLSDDELEIQLSRVQEKIRAREETRVLH